jgi:hypothetical protein
MENEEIFLTKKWDGNAFWHKFFEAGRLANLTLQNAFVTGHFKTSHEGSNQNQPL